MPESESRALGPLKIARTAGHVGVLVNWEQCVEIIVDKRVDSGDPLPWVRLIAAAPELAEVLAEIVSAWSESEHHDVPLALIDRARALLARLEGR